MRVEIDVFGNKIYCRENDDIHREDGPAIEYANGDKDWCIDGYIHREDGPARECVNGYKEWRITGKRHREDGPAREYSDGRKEWYLDDIKYSEQEFDKIILKYKWNKFVKDHQCV